MKNIENTESSMVQLWLRLERTEEVLQASYKRFCPRAVLKLWLAQEIMEVPTSCAGLDGTIFEVCRLSALEGYELLPSVRLRPRKLRELLRAIIAVTCGIGMRKVNTRALDRAYSQAFPNSTALNANKKKPSL